MSKPMYVGLLLIRIAFGLVLAAHGAMHVQGFQEFSAANGGPLLAACAIAGELGGGLGIAVGLMTRVAGLGLAAVMWYAAFKVHIAKMPFVGTMPGTVFEYPFLVGVVGVALFITGPGAYALDSLLFGAPIDDR